MNSFVSIAQLQNEHKNQIEQLQSKIEALEIKLQQQEAQLKQTLSQENAAHHQQALDSALAQQKQELNKAFAETVAEQVEQQFKMNNQDIRMLLANIENNLQKFVDLCLQHSVELAITALKKITTSDSHIKLDIVRKSLQETIENQGGNRSKVSVTMNPDDARLLQSIWNEQAIKLITSDQLASGDVIISSDVKELSGLLEERITIIFDEVKYG